MSRKFLTHLVVRNPRNLERLNFARKPKGYEYEKGRDLLSHYYRAELHLSNQQTTGVIKHVSEGEVLSASTSEWPISQRLYSSTDVSAASNVGRVFTRRCLQSEILYAKPFVSGHELTRSEKVKAFFSALEEGGVSLKEPAMIEPNYDVDPRYHWVYEDPEKDISHKPL